MIVKMKFMSITGPKADIDRVVNEYLSKYEIHLENALSKLKTVKNLSPYIEINPYKDWLIKANDFTALINDNTFASNKVITLEEALKILQSLDADVNEINLTRDKLEEKKTILQTSLLRIEPFLSLDCNIHDIMKFKFIHFRFGKIARDYYDKLERYIYENKDAVFFKCHNDDQYIWGLYFTPASQKMKADAVFSSLHFERIFLPDDYDTTPKVAWQQLMTEMDECNRKINECKNRVSTLLSEEKENILLSQDKLQSLSTNFDVRKLLPVQRTKHKSFISSVAGCPSRMQRPLNGISQKTAIYFVSLRTMAITK